MHKNKIREERLTVSQEKSAEKEAETTEQVYQDEKERLTNDLRDLNDKYLRIYAEFENYKKRVNKDKEELISYGNESLISELLIVLDNLEMALHHASDNISNGLVQGVEITQKELKKTLEKFGLVPIVVEEGKLFDPLFHHAMTQVEREDLEDNTIVEELRKGYMLKDKVLRPTLVVVSKKIDTTK